MLALGAVYNSAGHRNLESAVGCLSLDAASVVHYMT